MKKLWTCLSVLLLAGAAPASNKEEAIVLTKGNFIVMDQVFSDDSVSHLLVQAKALDADRPSRQPLYLILVSPGGSIEAGLMMIDNLKAFNRPVETISIFSASMSFHTAQGLGTRYLTPTGIYMSHKAKGGFEGEFPGQLDSRYNFYKRRLERLDERVVARSGGKLTKESYQKMYQNEFWCEGQDCIDKGVADAVANVYCDSSLKGTVTENMKVSFLGIPLDVQAVKAACPTILGVLDIKVKKNNRTASLDSTTELRNIPELSHLSPESLLELQKFIKSKVDVIYGQNHEVVRN